MTIELTLGEPLDIDAFLEDVDSLIDDAKEAISKAQSVEAPELGDEENVPKAKRKDFAS